MLIILQPVCRLPFYPFSCTASHPIVVSARSLYLSVDELISVLLKTLLILKEYCRSSVYLTFVLFSL